MSLDQVMDLWSGECEGGGHLSSNISHGHVGEPGPGAGLMMAELPLWVHFETAELHDKLCLEPLVIITSQVIIKVSLCVVSVVRSVTMCPVSRCLVQPVMVLTTDQGFHHLSLHHLLSSARCLHCGWVPLSKNISINKKICSIFCQMCDNILSFWASFLYS